MDVNGIRLYKLGGLFLLLSLLSYLSSCGLVRETSPMEFEFNQSSVLPARTNMNAMNHFNASGLEKIPVLEWPFTFAVHLHPFLHPLHHWLVARCFPSLVVKSA